MKLKTPKKGGCMHDFAFIYWTKGVNINYLLIVESYCVNVQCTCTCIECLRDLYVIRWSNMNEN